MHEERHELVLELLQQNSAAHYAWHADDDGRDEFVTLTVAIRDVGTAELTIERAHYDAAALLEFIAERFSRNAA